jgi:ParB family chromosome partitioning protein
MNQPSESIVEIPLGLIERGFFQPREYFDSAAMEATRRSIQEKGQKYPVIVRPIQAGNPLLDASWPELHYELADGERRFRCCQDLGFSTLKALIRDLSDEEMLDYTLTTNDSMPLNPIEKAVVFSRLAKEFGKSQADIAKSFNLKQQQVSEYMRLLELPKEIQDLTARAVISVRHARELLKFQDHDKMKEMAIAIRKSSISTRELSKIVKSETKSQKIDVKGEKIQKIEESGINLIERAAIYGENSLDKPNNWLENANRSLIPSSLYQKLEYWLSFELGSRLKPEVWLLRVEISIFLGVILSVLTLWLPLKALVSVVAIISTLLIYLYLS